MRCPVSAVTESASALQQTIDALPSMTCAACRLQPAQHAAVYCGPLTEGKVKGYGVCGGCAARRDAGDGSVFQRIEWSIWWAQESSEARR